MLNKVNVRGVCNAMREAGLIKFASDEMAMLADDKVAEAALPEEIPEEMPPETTAGLAANLSELADSLAEGAAHAEEAAEAAAGAEGGAGLPGAGLPGAGLEGAGLEGAGLEGAGLEGAGLGGAGGAGMEVMGAAKEAQVKKASEWLRGKLAAPPSDTGSTITGHDPAQTNEQDNSANAEATLDAMNRPGGKGYANVGVAGVGTQEASGKGVIGDEDKHPSPSGGMGPVAEDGSNSATEAVKSAHLLELIRKLAGMKTAGGTTLMPNAGTTADAATGEGKLDDANRPGGTGYANKGVEGVGQSEEAKKERAAAIGKEQPHPGTMGPVGQSGTNTAIQQSKTSAEQTYLDNFKYVAEKYAEFLPPRLEQHEKIAAVQYLMGQDPVTRDKIALHMSKTAEMPEGLKDYVEAKGNGNGEEKEEKEEKKDEKDEEKEASLSVDQTLLLIRGLTEQH